MLFQNSVNTAFFVFSFFLSVDEIIIFVESHKKLFSFVLLEYVLKWRSLPPKRSVSIGYAFSSLFLFTPRLPSLPCKYCFTAFLWLGKALNATLGKQSFSVGPYSLLNIIFIKGYNIGAYTYMLTNIFLLLKMKFLGRIRHCWMEEKKIKVEICWKFFVGSKQLKIMHSLCFGKALLKSINKKLMSRREIACKIILTLNLVSN